ncbi:MAG: site-specific integrase [Acidobacteriota bacterium]
MAGQIVNRGKRTWTVRVFIGRDEKGKRHYHNKTIYGNKKDAEAALTDLMKERNAGTIRVGAENRLIGGLLDDLLRDYRLNGKSIEWCEIVVETHLRHEFGDVPISKFSSSLVNRYIEQRKAKGRANSTINRELALLRRSFSLGAQQDPPKVSRLPRIVTLKEDNVRKGFFEHDAYIALRDALPEELRLLLTFAYFTGCRKGELLPILWEQIDLDEGIARLEAGETKNDEPRIIPLAPELITALRFEWERREAEYPDSPWVFSRAGAPIRTFRRSWEKACKAAGLWDDAADCPSKLFHDLRRTGVRNLVRSGTPESVAQRISGHKTRAVFERYNIVTETDLRAAAKRLGGYLDDKTKALETEKERRAANQPGEDWHTIGTQTGKALN